MIGSYLTDRFLKEGHQVIGIDDFSFGNEVNLPDHSNFTFIKQDLSKEKINVKDVDVVCHLAAFKKPLKGTFDEEELRGSLSTQTISSLKEKLKDLCLPLSGKAGHLILLFLLY